MMSYVQVSLWYPSFAIRRAGSKRSSDKNKKKAMKTKRILKKVMYGFSLYGCLKCPEKYQLDGSVLVIYRCLYDSTYVCCCMLEKN